eukprot:SAG31_NODE_2863_length_4982_cov_2.545361_3_plen_44_part_00
MREAKPHEVAMTQQRTTKKYLGVMKQGSFAENRSDASTAAESQ